MNDLTVIVLSLTAYLNNERTENFMATFCGAKAKPSPPGKRDLSGYN